MIDDTPHKENERKNPPPEARGRGVNGTGHPVSRNKLMRDVLATVERVAASDANLIIVGEPGTGKEWTAHMIHRLSARSAGPFFPADCAAMPLESAERDLFGYEAMDLRGIEISPGIFERADKGTVLLNDVASLPAAVQMKILRTVEYRTIRRLESERETPVDVRIIAALSEDPAQLVRKEALRRELYYSISPIVIELPPLRKRREDIPLLVEEFLEDLCNHNGPVDCTFSPEALQLCLEYDWPGNVRLLRNAVEYATVMCGGGAVRPEHLPGYLHKKGHTAHPPTTVG